MSDKKIVLEIKKLNKAVQINYSAKFRHTSGKQECGVAFSIKVFKSECLGLWAESRTYLKMLSELIAGQSIPFEGQMILMQNDLLRLSKKEFKTQIEKIGKISDQFPGSFTNLSSVGSLIKKNLRGILSESDEDLQRMAVELIHSVDLDESILRKFPFQLNKLQKVQSAIAQLLTKNPYIVIFDEEEMILDEQEKLKITEIFSKLRKRLGLTIIILSNDLSFLNLAADRIGITRKARLIEIGPGAEILLHPVHPLTQSYVQAYSKQIEDRIYRLADQENKDLPACPFAKVCRHALQSCLRQSPALVSLSEDHQVACHMIEARVNQEYKAKISAFNLAI